VPCATIYGGVSTRCVVTSETDSIDVRVSAIGPDDFELTVRAVVSGSEGRVSSPIEIELLYSGVTASAAPSYYVLSGLTPNATYMLRGNGTEENVYATVCELQSTRRA
jgi:hypothetical protein